MKFILLFDEIKMSTFLYCSGKGVSWQHCCVTLLYGIPSTIINYGVD